MPTMTPAQYAALGLEDEEIEGLRTEQRTALNTAAEIREAAVAAHPRSLLRSIHEMAHAAIVTVALDSRFFTAHEQAAKDIQTITKGHARIVGFVERLGKSTPRSDLKKFARIDMAIWQLIAARYPDDSATLA